VRPRPTAELPGTGQRSPPETPSQLSALPRLWASLGGMEVLVLGLFQVAVDKVLFPCGVSVTLKE